MIYTFEHVNVQRFKDYMPYTITMKSLKDFQSFLRAEKGLYYFSKFAPYFAFSDIDSLLNFATRSCPEAEIRCMEYLWKVFQEGDIDVNIALKQYNSKLD